MEVSLKVRVRISRIETEVAKALPMRYAAMGGGVTLLALDLAPSENGRLAVKCNVNADAMLSSASATIRGSGRPRMKAGELFLEDAKVDGFEMTGVRADKQDKALIGGVLGQWASKAESLGTRIGLTDAAIAEAGRRLEQPAMKAAQAVMNVAAREILSRMPLYKRTLATVFVEKITVEGDDLVFHPSKAITIGGSGMMAGVVLAAAMQIIAWLHAL